MGKRLNVFVSDEAYAMVREFQAKNRISNLDDALDKFILKNK